MIKIPLRLDIAGAWTDLPSYRHNGAHLILPLDYYVCIQAQAGEALDENGYVGDMNARIAAKLNVPIVNLCAHCELEHGAGLGSSSSTVVGMIEYYNQLHQLDLDTANIAIMATEVIAEKHISGRQDEYSAAYKKPLYLRYHGDDMTIVDEVNWSPKFIKQIESWTLFYFPRSMSGQEILNYEINLQSDMSGIVNLTEYMSKAIQNNDFDAFWRRYRIHWQVIEERNPYKINDAVRLLRRQNAGTFIRACGAGAGGYTLIHGNIGLDSAIPVRIKK